jgi:hypothetical protein
MSKFFAAIFSALSVSLLTTTMDYTPINERAEDTYYYSFGHLFFFGLPILLGLYIILIIPVTFLIDGLVSRNFRERNGQWFAVTLVAYCAAFGLLALLFAALSPLKIERDMLRGFIHISLVIIPFFIYQELFRWMGKKIKAQK